MSTLINKPPIVIIKGGTPKSDKSPLKWEPPPNKQPWGLLIRCQH